MTCTKEPEYPIRTPKARLWGSVRLLIAVLACFSMTVNYAQRMNLTVGILCMVNHTALSPFNSTASGQNKIDGPFLWDRFVQGEILSAYSYGYIILQFFGGLLTFYFGAVQVNFTANLFTTVFTLLSPLVAGNHVVFTVFRSLIGLFGGLTWPSLFPLMARWAPINERSRLISVVFAGISLGSIITPPLSGALCSLSSPRSWSYIFYATGGMGVLWCILWLACVRSDPANHPFISEREKYYLMNAIELNRADAADERKKSDVSIGDKLKFRKVIEEFFMSMKTIPFRCILSSISCRGLFLADFFCSFVYYMVVTDISTFTYDNSNTSLLVNGLTSALPFVGFLIMNLISSQICDYIHQRNIISRNLTRKIFVSISMFVPTIFLFLLAFTDKSKIALPVAYFTLIMAFTGCNYGGGFYLTPNDIAPQYSGIIWGISNTFATIPAIILPIIIGTLTKDGSDAINDNSWKIVMIICGVCTAFTGMLFNLFVRTELEPWAVITEPEISMSGDTTEISEGATEDSDSSVYSYNSP